MKHFLRAHFGFEAGQYQCSVVNTLHYATSVLQVPGDLDPRVSPHYLTTMKKAYLKLRYLVDSGCIFVGHDLRHDFKSINIIVPPQQVTSHNCPSGCPQQHNCWVSPNIASHRAASARNAMTPLLPYGSCSCTLLV